MAIYEFPVWAHYPAFAGGGLLSVNGPNTFQDPEWGMPWPEDLGFEVTKWITGTDVAIQGTYLGTTQHNGHTLLVLESPGIGPGSDYYLLSPEPFVAGTFPEFFTATEAALVTEEVFITCFLTGTLIATGTGETAVENLKIGDRVLTETGKDAAVKWIGKQTVLCRFGAAERLSPVRFAAGSLGGGLPHSELTVTADHALLVDGVLCNAGALVNGVSITRVPLSEMGNRYTVYHIETEEHEIILANGAPAETFIDNVSRRVFDNYAEFEALYGDVPEMEELPYPRAMSARQVPRHIRDLLAIEGAA